MVGGDDKQVFAKDGPTHMIGIEIDWHNDEHRRCITASLVKSTYVMEMDRTSGREGKPTALAPAWWRSFHFRHQREYKLEFECDECAFCRMISKVFHGATATGWCIYGAVFQYAPPPDARVANRQSAPSYIVAFRGTMREDPAAPFDMRNNLMIVLNKQHSCPRFSHARDMVEMLVYKSSGGSVWLAGHSLGASIGLDVGRHMMINWGINLETFLFNPPLPSLIPAVGKDARTRRDVFVTADIGRCVVGAVLRHHRKKMKALFQRLAPWVPNLYVNPEDTICESFIAYFEKRDQEDALLRAIAMEATLVSGRDVIFRRKSERPHLLPSAKLWKNEGLLDPHGIRQWWKKQDSKELTHKLYQWP